MVEVNAFYLHRHGDFALKDWPLVQPPASPFLLIRRNRYFTVVPYLQSPGCPLIIPVSPV